MFKKVGLSSPHYIVTSLTAESHECNFKNKIWYGDRNTLYIPRALISTMTLECKKRKTSCLFSEKLS